MRGTPGVSGRANAAFDLGLATSAKGGTLNFVRPTSEGESMRCLGALRLSMSLYSLQLAMAPTSLSRRSARRYSNGAFTIRMTS